MNFGVVFEPVEGNDFAPGYYYAHAPSLGLTAHGIGIEGARAAAVDLVCLWLAEKRAGGESVPSAQPSLFSTLEIPEDALRGA